MHRPPSTFTGSSRPASCCSGSACSPEAVVGDEVWQRRAWRAYLWPGLLFGLGVADVAGDGLLHELDDPHDRPRRLGPVDDARRRRRARARAREAAQRRAWRLAMPLALVVSGAAILVHEQNGWFFARAAFLHHVVGWTLSSARSSRSSAPSGPARPGWQLGVRAHAGRRSRSSSTRIATSRRSSATSRRSPGRRTGEARCSRRCCSALAVARGGFGACARGRRPRRSGSGWRARRRASSSASTSASRRCPNAIGSRREGPPRLRARRARDGRRVVAPVGGCRAAPTRCAGRRSRPTATSSRASSPSACGARAAGDRRRRRGGPTTTEHIVRWLYFLALALLVGGLGFRLLVCAGRCAARPSGASTVVTGVGAVGALEVGILAFLLRAEDALQLPFGSFLYGDLSPIAAGRASATAFIAMTLGFALVAALALPRLADRPRELLWPAFVLSLGFASGLSLSGHSAADAGSSWLSELADWAHLAAASLWVGGLVQLAVRRLAARAGAAADRVPALLAARDRADRGAARRRDLPQHPAAAARSHDLWTVGYGQVLLVKLALVSLALLWGAVHHFVVAAGARARRRRFAGLPRSLTARAPSGWRSCSSPPCSSIEAAAAAGPSADGRVTRRDAVARARSATNCACPGCAVAADRDRALVPPRRARATRSR